MSSFTAIKHSAIGIATEAQTKLHELEFLQQIYSKLPSHPGYAHVVHLQDHFYQEGPAGRHLCLVMEPLLEDLRMFSMRWLHCLIPLPMVRHLARQIVLGLQYLHDECNIIHTGNPRAEWSIYVASLMHTFIDIKPANILLTPPGDPSLFFAKEALDAHETSVAKGPDGTLVTRVRSYPIMYPLSDWGQNSTDQWRSMQAKIGDVGVGA